jgi:ankyrin repeat protein
MSFQSQDEQLIKASEAGDFRNVKRLVRKGTNVNTVNNEYGSTPLHYASWKGHKTIVKWLIHNGADVNAVDTRNGCTPLHYASKFNESTAKLLIDK